MTRLICSGGAAGGGGGVGLVVNTLDSGSRGLGFEPNSGRRVVFLSKIYLPLPPKKKKKKVLVLTKKRWLRPNMTEKLFTVTFSIKSYHIYGNILTLLH